MNNPTLRTTLRYLACGFTAAALVVGGAGCSGGLTGLCDDVCDCTGDCSENFRAECVDTVEDIERSVDDEGCDDQLDRYTDCLNDEFECRNGRVDLDGCGSRRQDLEGCLRSNLSLPWFD